MEFAASFDHRPPVDQSLRRRYYEAKSIRRVESLNGPQLFVALSELEALGYTFADASKGRPSPITFQMFLSFKYTPEDWATCESFEPDLHLLADNGVEVRYPLSEDGSARILRETMDFNLPEFVLAGAVGLAFVRDPVKIEMEQEGFVGLAFSRAGVLCGRRQGDEIELGEGELLMHAPLTGEKLWQIRSSVMLPTPVSVPEEQRTHRPLAHRTDLPEEMRRLGVVENRLVFTRSSLDALGPFDIGFLPQPPHPHGNELRVSPPRVVVSRRLKDWLTMRLRPVWRAEEARHKATNAPVPWTEAMHDRWRPVTIAEG